MSDPTSFCACALSNLDLLYFRQKEIDLSLGIFKDGSDPYGPSTIATTSYSRCFQQWEAFSNIFRKVETKYMFLSYGDDERRIVLSNTCLFTSTELYRAWPCSSVRLTFPFLKFLATRGTSLAICTEACHHHCMNAPVQLHIKPTGLGRIIPILQRFHRGFNPRRREELISNRY